MCGSGNGCDNVVICDDDLEMVTIDNVFDVPLQLESHAVLLCDLFQYIQQHQSNSSLYRSEFAVSFVFILRSTILYLCKIYIDRNKGEARVMGG